jgi:predicted TIM-barrel fold metal-dependent hydrolase
MADAAELVAAFPDVTFVLVHAGMPVSLEPAEATGWRSGLRLLAEHPNVVVKLTGQGTFVHRVDPGLIDEVTATCLELFGADRCMWGSNFPVEKIWTDLPALLAAWRRSLGRYPLDVRRAVFAGTARRVYTL